jgi:2-polyprenyl-6-hydroxyphenyl methylase/3-demethylubiquinone-9 3-methyltransferase
MGYYSQKLAAGRLRAVYDLAPPRVRQYLRAEERHVAERIPAGARVLDLGCGYGRTMRSWAEKAGRVVGVDTALDSLEMGRDYLQGVRNTALAAMDAGRLGFKDAAFDVTACIQNGISAFKVEPKQLMEEALRITRSGGKVLFSSYSSRFWSDRLDWFRIQSLHGLLGEIDEEATGDGVIVCKDGFRATTFAPADFLRLASECGVGARVHDVDDSSVFCEIEVP